MTSSCLSRHLIAPLLLALACGGVPHDDVYRALEDAGIAVEGEEGVLANDEGGAVRSMDVATARGGVINELSDGGFAYAPEPGVWGRDSFSYAVGSGADDTATVTLVVLPVSAPAEEIATEDRGQLIEGASAQDELGRAAAAVGDVNGDGFDDIVTSTPLANTESVDDGRVYVLFGGPSRERLTLAAASAGGGFVVGGESNGQRIGRTIAAAGDMNGDALADFALCDDAYTPQPANDVSAGRCYVVFGKADGDPVALAEVAAGQGGFVIDGVTSDERLGFTIAGGGDVNGDGFDDLIVGSDESTSASDRGRLFVVLGGDALRPTTSLELAAGVGGREVPPPLLNLEFARRLAMLGDINEDGRADFAVYVEGATSVLLHQVFLYTGDADLALADPYYLKGSGPYDDFGAAIAPAGDVNGDGADDILIGAPGFDVGVYDDVGQVYVMYGGSSLTSGSVRDAPEERRGFVVTLKELEAGWAIGERVGPAGDLDGDGLDDLTVTVRKQPSGYGDSEAPIVFVVFGQKEPDPVHLDQLAAGDRAGFALVGGPGSEFGALAFSPGDVDGDGVSDLLITDPSADSPAANAGAVHLLYGLGPPAPGPAD
ncbi:MAG: hypothetical protein R3A51_16035 [Nannocystaceae bacterium]